MKQPLLIIVMFVAALLMVEAPAWWGGYDAYAAGPSEPAPEGSPSRATRQTVDDKGQPINCDGVPEAKGGVLLGGIMPCLTYTIEKSTQRFTQEMVDWLRPLLYTFLTLVITLFGIKILQKEPGVHKQGFLLMVKVTLVITALNSLSTDIVPSVYQVMRDSQDIVIGALDTTSMQCGPDQAEGKKYAGPNTPRVWVTMDCVLGKLFGFTTGSGGAGGTKTPNMLLVTSIFGTLAGFFFGGAWGAVIFFGMVAVLVSIFSLVVRVALIFISGYLNACLMLIICPLMMPLLFLNVTKQYFDGVWKNIMAAFLMPIMVTSYAMIAFMVYDQMLFAKDSILQNILKYDAIKEALQNPRKACDGQVTSEPRDMRFATKPTESQLSAKFISPFLINMVMPALTGANDACAFSKIPNLNIHEIKDDHDRFRKGKEAFTALFDDLLKLFILGYLVHLGLGSVTGLLRQIAGSGVAVQSTGAATPIEAKFSTAAKAARQKAFKGYTEEYATDTTGSKFRNIKGTQFIKRSPHVMRDSATEFFKVLTK